MRRKEFAMEAISAEYLLLFNEISMTLEELDLLRARLVAAQQQAEEMYIKKSA